MVTKPISQNVSVSDESGAYRMAVNSDGSINTLPALAPDYEAVAAAQTDQVLGATGAVGDWLATMVCTVATAATSTVSITDGGDAAIPVLAANTPIGAYTITLNLVSADGAWQVTTGAGVSVVATGRFT